MSYHSNAMAKQLKAEMKAGPHLVQIDPESSFHGFQLIE